MIVVSAAHLAAGPSGPRRVSRGLAAADWLVERFRESRAWWAADLFDAAHDAGISRNAVFEAKTLLGVPRARRVVRLDGDVSYFWTVPEDWEHL